MKTSATHKTTLADMQDSFDTFLCIHQQNSLIILNLPYSKDCSFATLCQEENVYKQGL